MTTSYNRTEVITFYELSEEQKKDILENHSYSEEDAEEQMYVMFDGHAGKEIALPLGVFIKTENNKFTHGIYSTSAFDGYFITFDSKFESAIIAHKYF